MKRLITAAAAGIALSALAAASALAALPVGTKAPEIKTKAALAGADHDFTLTQSLKKGPVVLYFFPAAFTQGCTLEAHEFAEATPEFQKLGATVVGMTAGNVDRIKEFSKSECRDKFAVGAASAETIKAYDVAMATRPNLSTRTSYVIAPDGKILLSYTDGNFEHHVDETMKAVKAWRATRR